MDKSIVLVKSLLSGVGAVVLTKLGGYDYLLELLLTLMGVDVLFGIFSAIVCKELSSNDLRRGLIRKVSVFFLILIANELDMAIFVDQTSGVGLNCRSFVIVWFCLDEVISLLEHCSFFGVPLPKWLKSTLVQVRDSVSTSIPKRAIEFLNKFFNNFFGFDISIDTPDNEDFVLEDTTEMKSDEKSEDIE